MVAIVGNSLRVYKALTRWSIIFVPSPHIPSLQQCIFNYLALYSKKQCSEFEVWERGDFTPELRKPGNGSDHVIMMSFQDKMPRPPHHYHFTQTQDTWGSCSIYNGFKEKTKTRRIRASMIQLSILYYAWYSGVYYTMHIEANTRFWLVLQMHSTKELLKKDNHLCLYKCIVSSVVTSVEDYSMTHANIAALVSKIYRSVSCAKLFMCIFFSFFSKGNIQQWFSRHKNKHLFLTLQNRYLKTIQKSQNPREKH